MPKDTLDVMDFSALEKDAHERARVLSPLVRTKSYIKDEAACLDKHPRQWPFGGEPMLVAAERLCTCPQKTNEVAMFGCAGCSLGCWFCFAGEILADESATDEVAIADLHGALYSTNIDVQRVSGGEPFLQLPALIEFLWAGNVDTYYWIDTNLSIRPGPERLKQLAETVLDGDIGVGICGCFKGLTDADVALNTGTDLDLTTQFAVAQALWDAGLDMYFYVVDAGVHPTVCGRSKRQKVRDFIDRLQAEVHRNAPLRTVPIEIHEYECATGTRPEGVIVNEFGEHWMDGLSGFYSADELIAPLHLVPMR